MIPRIFGKLGDTEYDETFDNNQEGWAAAWESWQELSAMSGESGMLAFEFCGHGETPVKPCSLVARKIWGDGGGPNH